MRHATRTSAARAAVAAVAAALILTATPAAASAHGPVAPVATGYLARVDEVPTGLDAKVVDGYVRMWLHVPAGETVVVLDYRNIPYLRFSASGVEVNHNSTMYYLNETPIAQTPPSDLNRTTPPNWQPASGAHSYEWHDGRLQALASVAVSPGTRYVGRWSIPIVLAGRPAAIAGGLFHAPKPSIVWFWPLVVAVACVLAAWRIRNPALDARLARILGLAALVGLSVAAIGQELHGRPSVPPLNYVELAAILAFALWGLRRVLFRRAGYASYFLIALVALWEGLNLIPTLLNGYVLVDLPAFVARTATVLCLGSGIGILLLVFRLADARQRRRPSARRSDEGEQDPERLHEAYEVG